MYNVCILYIISVIYQCIVAIFFLVFHHYFLSQAKKINQDRFLLKFMNISNPASQKRMECNNLKPKSPVTKCTAWKENGEIVPVCAKYFTASEPKVPIQHIIKKCVSDPSGMKMRYLIWPRCAYAETRFNICGAI